MDRQEDLYLQRVGIYHVEFGGLGGDVADITLAREAYNDLGKPEMIQVTVTPIFEEED